MKNDFGSKFVGGTSHSSTRTGSKGGSTSGATTVGYPSTSRFTPVGSVTIGVEFVGSATNGRARVLVGARVASTIGDRRTTNLAAVVKIIIIVKLVGSATNGRARSSVRARAARTARNGRAAFFAAVCGVTVGVEFMVDSWPFRRSFRCLTHFSFQFGMERVQLHSKF